MPRILIRILDRHRTLRALYKVLLAKRRGLFAGVIVLALASAAAEGIGLSLIYPLLNSVVGTEPISGRPWNYIYAIAGAISPNTALEGLIYLAAIVFFAKALLALASAAVATLLVGRLSEDWTLAAMRSYLHGPYSDIVNERRGRIMQKIAGESGRAAKGVDNLINLFVQANFAAVMFATLLLFNWKAMLSISVLSLLFVLLLNSKLLGPVKKFAKQRLSESQKLMAAVSEPIVGAEVVKLLGVEDTFAQRISKPLRRLTRMKVLAVVIKKAPSSFVEFVVIVSVAIVLAVMRYAYSMPFEQILPLIGVFTIVSARLLTVMSSMLNKRLDFASIVPSLMIVRGALEKQNLRDQSYKGAVLTSVDGDVELCGVTFGYGSNHQVFKNLSLVIPKGKLVAVVGPSGVGKSTLGYLLARLYEPDAGVIRIHGRDIRDFSVASLRSRIGFVEQSPVMFNGTVEENIRIGRPEVTGEQVWEAAKAAGIHEFILSLPNGYDSMIKDQGATLSGGQRQRIALARAFVRQPDLFIIDEGTSALDRASEAVVHATMRRVAKNATVLFITHRIASTEAADLIYEFMPGCKVARREFYEIA